jgi:hypothetical protein
LSWSFTTRLTRTQRSAGLIRDPVHVARDVHHKTFCQRLAVGAGSAAARGEYDLLEAGLGRDTREAHQVIDVARKHDKLGKQLID